MNGPQASPDDRREIQRRVEFDQAAALFKLSPQPVIAGIVFSVIVGIVLWPQLGGPLLAGWLALRVLISSTRVLDARQFNRSAADQIDLPRRWRRFMLLMTAECCTWSALGLLFTGVSTPQIDSLLLASVAVVSAVSVFSLGSDFRASSLFFSVVLVPNGLMLLWQGTRNSVFLGSGLLTIFVMLLLEARGLERRMAELIRLRHENAAIAEQRQRALLLAEHSNQVKSRFLAIVSHEMRTPLNGILGMTQMLRRSTTNPAQLPQLAVIEQSSRHLNTVIGDLLDLSKIEAGRLAIETGPFRLETLVREVTELLEPLASQKGLYFEVHREAGLPAWIETDGARLKQVLHNLLGNAIKFTTVGKVSLSIAREHDQLAFTVRDTGIGIAADQTDRIFRAFEQAAAPGSPVHRAGIGLGLTISRDLARAMGGDVVCQSEAGAQVAVDKAAGGAVFRFTLPCRPCAAPETPTPTAAPGALSPLAGHVLLVEDNAINALIAREMLELMGLTVTVAGDGQQALDRLRQTPFDAVLMDCQMPVLDGWQATRQWRAHERDSGMPRTPIIAITANAVSGDRERCHDAGMDDYLAKPYELDDLASIVRRHLAA
ncbi:MAG: response regulator [Burkholderiaceae bacterium]|nr:response regulator [Burkholderiaceae bacterium]